MKFAGKSITEFELVQLESISKFSNYNDFINDRDKNTNVFGTIIVCEDVFGRTREIISGKYIPCIKVNHNSNNNESIITIPNSPYHGRIINYGLVSAQQLRDYVNTNYTNDYIDKINNFVENANEYYKNNKTSLIKKLLKKIK